MKRTHPLFVVAALLVSGCGSNASDEGPTASPLVTTTGIDVTPQFFGQHWSSVTEWPSISFGSGAFGPGIEWSSIEPARGQFDFGSLDKWIAANAQAGRNQDLTFMYSIIHTPSWAGGTGNPSSDLYTTATCQNALAGVRTTDCSMKEYLVAVLDHVCTGTAPHMTCAFTSWELHNEVNASDTEWSGTYAELARMDADAIETIKSRCASCTVLSSNVSAGGDGYHALGKTSAEWDVFLSAYLAAWPAGAAMPDVLAWHPYPSHDNLVGIPFPETYAGSDCPSSPPNKVCRQTVVEQVQKMRQIADGVPGMKGKPIWATEGGFANVSLTDSDPAVEASLRAAYVSRWLLALASGGVAREFWYMWDDPSWGTEFSNGKATSVGVATQQVYDWIAGRTFAAACSNGGVGTAWSCRVTGANGLSELIVWNTAGSSTFSVPSTYHWWRDLTGPTKHALGSASHTIGIEPIEFSNQ